MIGIDTNVLLRAFVGDDKGQSETARSFIGSRTAENPAFVCIVTLVEFAWSLRRTFGYSREQVEEAVRRLVEANDVVVERQELVQHCLDLARAGKIAIADVLVAEINRAEGCAATMTFDRQAAKLLAGMELLA